MTGSPAWFYDELRQVGIDFADASEVEAYDRNQGSNAETEQALIRRLGLGAGDTVIDLGAGTASFALEAARNGAIVHAVDVSPAMLEHARRKAARAGIATIAFHRGGFLTYEHRGAPADAIVTRYALHHLPDFWKMAALLRMAEMLRPGGRLYLEDVVFSFEPAAYRTGIETWIRRVAKPPGEGFTAEAFHTHIREEHSTYGWILEGMLARAGFTIDEATVYDDAYAAYLCSKPG